MNEKPIFVAGATGYVGGRLVPMLLEDGYRVRALARSPAKIRGRPWGGHPLLEWGPYADAVDKEPFITQDLRRTCAMLPGATYGPDIDGALAPREYYVNCLSCPLWDVERLDQIVA